MDGGEGSRSTRSDTQRTRQHMGFFCTLPPFFFFFTLFRARGLKRLSLAEVSERSDSVSVCRSLYWLRLSMSCFGGLVLIFGGDPRLQLNANFYFILFFQFGAKLLVHSALSVNSLTSESFSCKLRTQFITSLCVVDIVGDDVITHPKDVIPESGLAVSDCAWAEPLSTVFTGKNAVQTFSVHSRLNYKRHLQNRMKKRIMVFSHSRSFIHSFISTKGHSSCNDAEAAGTRSILTPRW